MEDIEKKIESYALRLSNLKPGFDRQEEEYYQSEKVRIYDLTKQVVKSNEAKEYWFAVFEAEKSETEKRLDEYVRNNFDGKPSYSEEEVGELLEQAIGAFQSITRNRTSWSC